MKLTYRKMGDTAYYYDGSNESRDAYISAIRKKDQIFKNGRCVGYIGLECLEITPDQFKNWKGPKFSFCKESQE